MCNLRDALEDLVDAIPAEVWSKLPNPVRSRVMMAMYPRPQTSPVGVFVEGYKEILREMSDA